ncbi:DMT family transporter [Rhodovibrionaceae bacterium A322]
MIASTARNNLIGVLSALGASFFFSLNDMLMKLLSGGYALHQAVLLRSVIGLVILLVLFLPFEGGLATLRTKRLPLHIARGLCVVFANMTFFLALAAMPLVDAVAIFFISPLMITLFSVIFLGESVGPRRWVAVAMGFAGVVVMMRPGSEAFQLAALLPLISAVAYAGLNILTRKMGGTERATTLTFYIQVTFIVVSAAMGLAAGDGRFAGGGDPSLEFLLRAWIWPNPDDYWIFLMVGASATTGGYLISQAYRLCEAGLAAPFEYSALVMAIFWGLVVFGEWPDSIAWVGISLIVGGGLFMLWREAVQNARQRRGAMERIG